jgi:uncharacterized membrane protein
MNLVLLTLSVSLGLIFAAAAIGAWRRASGWQRVGNGAFWSLLSFAFLTVDFLPSAVTGLLVLVIFAIAASGLVTPLDPLDEIRPLPNAQLKLRSAGLSLAPLPDQVDAWRIQWAELLGKKLWWPLLVMPVATAILAFTLPKFGLVRLSDVQIAGLSLLTAVFLSLCMAMATLPVRLRDIVHGGADVALLVNWTIALPLSLALFGVLINQLGAGALLADGLKPLVDIQNIWHCLLAYTVGMSLLTMLMGNAFAAFPIMFSAIGLPWLIKLHGGHAAPIAALGMLSGYCGTLLTPMAANYNILPTQLLEISDRYAVIKEQIATAIPLWIANFGLLYWLAFYL